MEPVAADKMTYTYDADWVLTKQFGWVHIPGSFAAPYWTREGIIRDSLRKLKSRKIK